MLEHVYERTAQARYLTSITIATDDERIAEAARRFGAPVRMTRADHLSGTDRVAEVASSDTAELIVNIQGDEPLIDPAAIDAAILPLLHEDDIQMSTLKKRIENPREIGDPNVVKVVTDRAGRFRRTPGAAIMHFVAALYTFTGSGPDVLGHDGLDLSASMFAPCWLGCPGTHRQHAVSAARRGYRQPHRTAGGGRWRQVAAGIVIARQQFRQKNRTEQRTLNLRAHRSSCRVSHRNLITTNCAAVQSPAGGADGPPRFLEQDLRQPSGCLAHSNRKRTLRPGDPARYPRRYTAGTRQVHHQSATGT